jgi:hypothetical protein
MQFASSDSKEKASGLSAWAYCFHGEAKIMKMDENSDIITCYSKCFET